MGLPALPPPPPAYHQKADKDAIRRMKEYRAAKEAEDRRRTEARKRALIAESRRRAGETSQRK